MLASSSSTSGAFPSTSEAHVRSHPAAPAPWCSLSAHLGTMACRKRGRPRLPDPVASLPPSATPEEHARAKALSARRGLNRVSAKLSRLRKQARMAAVQREVEALQREHACLVAEHTSWVAALEDRYAQVRAQHRQHCVTTCRWPAAACDLVIAARIRDAALRVGSYHDGVTAPAVRGCGGAVIAAPAWRSATWHDVVDGEGVSPTSAHTATTLHVSASVAAGQVPHVVYLQPDPEGSQFASERRTGAAASLSCDAVAAASSRQDGTNNLAEAVVHVVSAVRSGSTAVVWPAGVGHAHCP